MRRRMVLLAVAFALLPGQAQAGSVAIQAWPNPAAVGQQVSHSVQVFTPGTLNIWVSARGFSQPGLGSLPPGSWTWQCCPGETNGTAAWHYRSGGTVWPGTYRFGATARSPGTFLSTARLGLSSSSVWIRIV